MLYLPTYRLQLQLLIDYNYNEAAGSSLQSPLLRLIIDAEHRRKARRKPMSERKHTHTNKTNNQRYDTYIYMYICLYVYIAYPWDPEIPYVPGENVFFSNCEMKH